MTDSELLSDLADMIDKKLDAKLINITTKDDSRMLDNKINALDNKINLHHTSV